VHVDVMINRSKWETGAGVTIRTNGGHAIRKKTWATNVTKVDEGNGWRRAFAPLVTLVVRVRELAPLPAGRFDFLSCPPAIIIADCRNPGKS
jgi:hypothetical protein